MGAVPPNAPPFWGMLIHYVSHPIYYQNYLLADMIAAQLHHVVKQKTKRNHILGNDRVAGFLTKHFFGHGKYYRWDELLKRVTGKPLNANAYLLSLRNDWR
jgi:Zn-dependent M32 family carboxypeptidase